MDIDIINALEITGLGLAGVFLFMTIFYFIITLLDKVFPKSLEKED